MGRRRKTEGQDGQDEQDLLSRKPVAAAAESRISKISNFKGPSSRESSPVEVPKMIEYTPLASTERWRVEKFDLLAAEVLADCHLADCHLAGCQAQMAALHELGQQYTRGWLILRRLYGIGPLIPSPDAHPDDLHPNSRAELCETLGLKPAELQAELDAMRALWGEMQKAECRTQNEEEVEPEKPKEELQFGDEVLREFGFEEEMFQVIIIDPQTKTEVARSQELNRAEREWFVKRVGEWRKMLQEPMASTLVREALLNDLYLKRFGTEMAKLGPGPRWDKLYASKKQLEQIYQEQLDKLGMMFPELSIAGKVSFRAVISDLNRAHREYYGRKDRRLVDKIYTATEIEVMLRGSVQAPEPRYRFGLNIAIVEAMHHLYDPDFRPQFKHHVLKKLDAGFKEGVVKMRETLNEPLVDLEKGVMPGEGEQFEDLTVGQEGEREGSGK